MRNHPKTIALILIALAVAALAGAGVAADSTLKPGDARKIIARLAGIDLPSDAVRVKEVSMLGNSAVVVAQVETAFRLLNENGKWRVAEIRTGNNRWENVDLLLSALNAEKAGRARAELNTMGLALENFRHERGFYIEADNSASLFDHLSPRYLTQVTRIDPWHQPYVYKGTRSGYILSSSGPDEKPGTSDDIIVSK